MNNEIRLSGIVGTDVTADSVAEQLKGLTGDIVINLNSPGGSYFHGAQIYNELRRYPGKKTIRMGALVASAAAYISCAGDELIASDNTSFMVHEVSSGAEGTSREIISHGQQVEKLNILLAKKLAERSGKSEKEIRALMLEETWFYGSEIVDAGFADRLEGEGAHVDRTAALAIAEKQYRHAAMATTFRLPEQPVEGSYADKVAPRDPVVIDFPDADNAAEDDYSMVATESAAELLTVPDSKSFINDDKTTQY